MNEDMCPSALNDRVVTERIRHMEVCILSLLNELAFGNGHGLDGGVNERLLREWYAAQGDNVRHAIDQLVRRPE